jgi:serine/threonine protein kinase
MLKSLNHPNIVRYVDSFEASEDDDVVAFYLVMEYCEGGDLGNSIQKGFPLEVLACVKGLMA